MMAALKAQSAAAAAGGGVPVGWASCTPQYGESSETTTPPYVGDDQFHALHLHHNARAHDDRNKSMVGDGVYLWLRRKSIHRERGKLRLCPIDLHLSLSADDVISPAINRASHWGRHQSPICTVLKLHGTVTKYNWLCLSIFL